MSSQGTTRLLLTQIPFFRQIIISSFSCDHCGFKDSEVQSAGEIQPRGAKYTFTLDNEGDLQRQIVKGDSSTMRIEDIDLEIPVSKGRFTNIEGIVSDVHRDLASHQDARMEQMPDVGRQVAVIISKLDCMMKGKSFPFTVSIDDPSGNSWIEPSPKDTASKLRKDQYDRTSQQNATLGIGDDVPTPHNPRREESGAPETEIRPEYHAKDLVGATPAEPDQGNNVDDDDEEDIVENEVYTFPASCPGCTQPCDTNMKMVRIPYFKQVVLMSTSCQKCGYRSNEVKTGGEVPEKGQKITLEVKTSIDMSRDVLKSESAALSCPELQLQVEPGTLGGRFTTVEGLLTQMRDDLQSQIFGLSDADGKKNNANGGDSMPADTKRTWTEFFDKLAEAIAGNLPFTLVLQDPLAGSYVQSLTAPEKDPQITVEDYERTEEEKEDMGLNDINTENYADGAVAVEEK